MAAGYRVSVGLVAVVLMCQPAHADEPPVDRAKQAASALLAAGNDQFIAGSYAAALTRFRAAYAAYPSAKIFLSIGSALDKLGRGPEAAEAYERYLVEGEGAEDQVLIARGALEELRRRLGRVMFAAVPTGTRITLDGTLVEPSPRWPRYVEPGTHAIYASDARGREQSLALEIAAGEEQRVTLALKPKPKPVREGPVPVARRRTWAWVAATTSVVLLGGGIGFGLHARAVNRDLRALRCSSAECPEQAEFAAKQDQVSREALVANIGFVGAGVAAIAAGLLFALEGREVVVAPTPGGVAIGLGGSF